jgi:DNA-binding transcriptional LysR family regulator
MSEERQNKDVPQLRLRGTNLALLVSLDVLLEECNVTRAAARLHLSQPALSAQLSRLRASFNDPLLVPASKGRGMVRTPCADRLRSRLRPALAELAGAMRMRSEEFRPEHSKRHFMVAASGTASAMVVPSLITRIQAEIRHGITLACTTTDIERLGAQLEKGELDLCFGPVHMLPQGMYSHELLTSPYVLLQRRGHPRGAGPVDLLDYCAQLEHVNIGRLHGHIDEQLYRLGQSRRVVVTVQEAGLVPAMLDESDLVCTLPAQLAMKFEGRIDIVPLAFPLTPYTLCAAWHARSDGDPAQQWLLARAIAAVQILAFPHHDGHFR